MGGPKRGGHGGLFVFDQGPAPVPPVVEAQSAEEPTRLNPQYESPAPPVQRVNEPRAQGEWFSLFGPTTTSNKKGNADNKKGNTSSKKGNARNKKGNTSNKKGNKRNNGRKNRKENNE